MDYDQTMMPASYDAGRSYSPARLEFWLKTIASAIGATKIQDILDLGCGTGRYSAALATQFGARVIGIDPSRQMLAQARRKSGELVRFEVGSAEELPVNDACIDMVFISMAFHHFLDRRKAVSECRRVLRKGGMVCLRAGTTDRAAEYPFVPFFPRTLELMTESLQSLASVKFIFTDAGFELKHHEAIQSEVATSWHEYADKIAYRVDSFLARLQDAEFESGLAMLRAYTHSSSSAQCVIEPVDFFVFQKI